tara:strand:+ start:3806 stop:4324 length:519 start_codon:yes stop_codon:yes gene_type:complete
VVVEARGRVMGFRQFRVTNIGTVNLETNLTSRDTDTARLIGRDEFDRVVEIEFLDIGSTLDSALSLRDEHVLGGGRERCAFISIQVDELRVNLGVRRWGRTPSDSKFNVVVLKRHQWNGRLGVLTEGESEWVKRSLIIGRRDEGLGIGLTQERWSDLERKFRGLFINDLSAN